jgi:hypothetical protein
LQQGPISSFPLAGLGIEPGLNPHVFVFQLSKMQDLTGFTNDGNTRDFAPWVKFESDWLGCAFFLEPVFQPDDEGVPSMNHGSACLQQLTSPGCIARH